MRSCSWKSFREGDCHPKSVFLDFTGLEWRLRGHPPELSLRIGGLDELVLEDQLRYEGIEPSQPHVVDFGVDGFRRGVRPQVDNQRFAARLEYSMHLAECL